MTDLPLSKLELPSHLRFKLPVSAPECGQAAAAAAAPGGGGTVRPGHGPVPPSAAVSAERPGACQRTRAGSRVRVPGAGGLGPGPSVPPCPRARGLCPAAAGDHWHRDRRGRGRGRHGDTESRSDARPEAGRGPAAPPALPARPVQVARCRAQAFKVTVTATRRLSHCRAQAAGTVTEAGGHGASDRD